LIPLEAQGNASTDSFSSTATRPAMNFSKFLIRKWVVKLHETWRRTILTLSWILWQFAAVNVLAEISVSSFDADGSMANGALTGTISAADVKQLARLLPPGATSERAIARLLSIESPGGDWNAAMAIGRILRRGDVFVWVGAQGCHSACVLVLAGAPRRTILGPVGIHRPYSSDVMPLSYSDAQQRYRALEAATKRYLEEMNLPASLFDAMARVPSESLRVLSKEEIVNFGLEGMDPVTADLQDAAEARKYGIDRRTYLERSARRDSLCPGLVVPYQDQPEKAAQVFVDCRREVMQGRR